MTDMPPQPQNPVRGDVSPPGARPVLPLEYRSEPRPGSRLAFVGRIVVGFVGYIVLSLAWGRLAVRSRLDAATVVFGWVLMTAALLGAALYLRTRHGRAGYGYGILLVFVALGGVVLLIIGMCWR